MNLPNQQGGGETPLGLTEELRARHADFSSTHVRFLEYLSSFPGGLEQSHFSPIHVADNFVPYAMQSWPLFLGADRRRRFEEATCAVSRLIRSVPQRFFDNDARRLGEFYPLSKAQMTLIASLMRTTGILEGATGRCDFLDTADGLKCVELNAGNVGGWQTTRYLDRIGQVPAVQTFLEQEAGEVFYRSPTRTLFKHFIDKGRALAKDGELNLCFAVGPASQIGLLEEFLRREYAAVLAALGEGLEGSLITCELSSLKVSGGQLQARGKRIHIIYETGFAQLTRPLLLALLAGKVLLYNGPTARVLGDKGNLALISEAAESDLFDEEERAAIKAWIPWTRRVVDGATDFKGERVFLPKWLITERQKMVLKARFSPGGKDVYVGRFIAPEDWAAIVQGAIKDGQWVVQEYLPSPPYLFLGESGCVLHDLVWGLFTFGDHFGGNFFRAQEQNPSSRGLVNATQGAGVGLVLEVEEVDRERPEYLEVSRGSGG